MAPSSVTSAMYGACAQGMDHADFARGPRRINIVPIALGLLLPWLIFCIVFAVMSFSLHYANPFAAYLVCGGAGFVVFCNGFLGAQAAKRSDPNSSPVWYLFVFVTGTVAVLLAVVAGNWNFMSNMQPFYDIMNLNVYPSVDPAAVRGQQLMDAGRLVFKHNTTLDLRFAMAFKNLDLYCVAPVTSTRGDGALDVLPTYDFWAVGINCCSASIAGGDFHCGEYSSPKAHAGLRLMPDDQRPFFRLAVQQAEAAYNIKATHPLFIYWMEDPITEVSAYQDNGFKYYLLGMFTHFAVQLFLTTSAVLVFSRAA